MGSNQINWTNIRAIDGSQQAGFEQLCAQLAEMETLPGATFVRNGRPDGGVECYIRLPDGSEWAWQAKFFLASLGDSQWQQLDESVETALEKYPELVRYTICVPCDLPDARVGRAMSARQRWDRHVTKWQTWAERQGRKVEFVFFGNHQLLDRLTQESQAGRVRFWFDLRRFDKQWFNSRLIEAVRSVGARYSPELNVDLPIAGVFDALGRTPLFFDRMKSNARGLRKKLQALGSSVDLPPGLSDAASGIASGLYADVNAVIECLSGLKPQPTGNLPFNVIRQRLSQTLESADELDGLLWQAEEQEPVVSPEQANPTPRGQRSIRGWQRHLREMRVEIRKVLSELESADEISSTSLLLMAGEAGAGKTHLLCDVATNRLGANQPTVLLLGQRFTATTAPWRQALDLLDLGDLTAEDFIGTLEAAAQVSNNRALIVLDALNEGQGRIIWPDHLTAFLTQVERSPWIAVALSVRQGYEESVVPEPVRKRAIRKTHHGFSSHEYDAARSFFTHYGLEFPSTPLLVPEFRNPLFLRTLCEGLAGAGHRRLPRGFHGISATFDLYLTSVNEQLSKASRLDFNPRRPIVMRALEAFAHALVDAGERWLPALQAETLINGLLPDRGFALSLYQGLLSEGLLIEAPSSSRGEEIAMISYERLADFLVASILLDKHLDSSEPKSPDTAGRWLASILDGQRYVPSGLLEALCVLVAERLGHEVPALFKGEDETHRGLWQAFRNSLVWRAPESITPDTIDLIWDLVRHESDLDATFDVLVTLASLPGHPINARFLDDWLRDLTVADRDECWSAFLHRAWGTESAVDRIIDWAWSKAVSIELEPEAVSLLGIVLAWMFSTSNRFLRDRATKALVNLLTTRVPICNQLVQQFANADDPYVAERVLAVAYGVAMRSIDKPGIEALALCVYDYVFASGAPRAHFLLRDYARGVIERAQSLGLAKTCLPSLFRPPYKSEWPQIPTEDEIGHLKPDWSRGQYDRDPADWSRNRIGSSVLSDDFSRYVIGTNSGRTDWLSLRLDEPAWEPPKTPEEKLSGLIATLDSSHQEAWEAFIQADEALGQAVGAYFTKWLAREEKRTGGDPLEDKEKANKRLVKALSRSSVIAALDAERETTWATFSELVGHRTSTEVQALITVRGTRLVQARPPYFDLSIIQRYVLWRVFDLDWTKDRFGFFDRYYVSMNGRSPNKAERIGKKYQWIALHEILALVADHFQYRESFSDDERDHRYEGPWQGHRRDIDPSSLLVSKPGAQSWLEHTPSWWGRVTYERWGVYADDSAWATATDDVPMASELLLSTRPSDGSRWVNLQGHFDWAEPVPADLDSDEVKRRHIWYLASGYLLRTEDVDSFITWARSVDFWGRWMPDPPEVHGMFLGEHVWSPAAKFFARSYFGDDGWKQPDYDCPVKVRSVAIEHLQEANGFDCSMDEGLRLLLPANDLVKGLNLHWTGDRAEYADSVGTLTVFDPTAESPGPIALLVREEALERFLSENGLALCWTVLGEKRVVGRERGDRDPRLSMRMTGAYVLRNGRVQGFLKCQLDERTGNDDDLRLIEVIESSAS